MRWEEYYDKLGDWATSTAVSRMSKLESFGPTDEIIDAINTIGFDDEKGATRLLKKAMAAGVKFSGDQLAELCLICDEAVLNQAIQFSADKFTTEDLDALYCNCDDDVLLDISRKHNITLPEGLADYEEPEEEYIEEEMHLSPAELAAEYTYILNCLQNAQGLLKKAYQFSLIDTSSKERAATVVKYTYIADAQVYIANALDAWNLLDVPDQYRKPLQGIWPSIRNSTMWKNYLFEGFLTNMMVKRQIRKVMKNIETAYQMIRGLLDAL